MSSIVAELLLSLGALGALAFIACGAIGWWRHRRECRAARKRIESRSERERRLRALGFEEPTADQRKENIDAALRDWLKD